ncbi:MAG: beta-galactosidase, partial [Clostridiales bacterium]|nr:beta-galactosidase [Clostridiales bacterium]
MSKPKTGRKLLSIFMCLLMIFTSAPYLFTSVIALAASDSSEDSATRLELNFNKNWKFNLGDISTAYMTAYSDASWESVDLPHDFSISQSYTLSGTEVESGLLPGGTGWYRKTFVMSEEYSGKSVILNFDGAYQYTYLYVNGTYVGANYYGYNSFSFDITDYLYFDGTTANVIAVKVENTVPSSRWYSGSGIYRDVTMTIVDPVHVSLYGTQVTTPNLATSNGSDGTTMAVVTVQNDGAEKVTAHVTTTVLDSSGNEVGTTYAAQEIGAGTSEDVTLEITGISNPALWSTESPTLYTLHTEITVNEVLCDEYDTTFGYRWFAFDQDTGFSLNGENLKIYGVCLHADQGAALGAVQEYDSVYRQLSIMKDMGVNSVRTGHDSPSSVFLQVCDELGILVMDEFFDGWTASKNGNTYDFSQYFNVDIEESNNIIDGYGNAWYEFVIKQTVKRDRNSASVIIWDLGNELASSEYNNTTIASNMQSIIQSMDDRPPVFGHNVGSVVARDSATDSVGGIDLTNYRGLGSAH